MNYANNAALRLKLEAWRARLMILFLMGLFVILAGRALYLQGLHNDFLQQKGEARYGRVIELSANRGMVSDRNGEPLAISTPVESIWASPEDVEVTSQQAKEFARLLGLAPAEIELEPPCKPPDMHADLPLQVGERRRTSVQARH